MQTSRSNRMYVLLPLTLFCGEALHDGNTQWRFNFLLVRRGVHLWDSRKPLAIGGLVIPAFGIEGICEVVPIHLCTCFVETIPEKRAKGIPPYLVGLAA